MIHRTIYSFNFNNDGSVTLETEHTWLFLTILDVFKQFVWSKTKDMLLL